LSYGAFSSFFPVVFFIGFWQKLYLLLVEGSGRLVSFSSEGYGWLCIICEFL
jgi:hypothetical protein